MAIASALKEIRESKPGLFDEIKRILAKEARKDNVRRSVSKDAPPIKVYKEVVRHNKCEHCGREWESTQRFDKGESVSWCDGGRFRQMVIMSAQGESIHINVSAMVCSGCDRYVRSLSREELESKYMAMLNNTTFERMSWMIRKERR